MKRAPADSANFADFLGLSVLCLFPTGDRLQTIDILRVPNSPLERGQNHKTARSVSFGIQGCV